MMPDTQSSTQNSAAKSIAEFASNNRISVRQTYDEIGEGRLRAVKVGSRTLILPEDEIAWRRRLPALPANSRGPSIEPSPSRES